MWPQIANQEGRDVPQTYERAIELTKLSVTQTDRQLSRDHRSIVSAASNAHTCNTHPHDTLWNAST